MNQNPYAATQASVRPVVADNNEQVKLAASGQKLVIYGILLNFLLFGMRGMPVVALAIMLVTLIMTFVGVVRVCGGLGQGTGMKIVCCILQFVPLINIITLLVLSSRATKLLREHGFEVGLLGARGI